MAAKWDRFDNITHLPLKIFNRTVMMNNILEDLGVDSLREYIREFTQVERKEMEIMAAYIKHKGQDQVRKEVTNNLEIVYDASKDD